jgi:5,10-methylenetetrahydrofolate reductase
MKRKLEEAGSKGRVAFKDENKRTFADLCREIRKRPGVRGIHMMAIGCEEVMPEILSEAGI